MTSQESTEYPDQPFTESSKSLNAGEQQISGVQIQLVDQ